MKTIRKGFALLFKTILITLLVAMLTPILYFAWRMGKPLPQPEFTVISRETRLEKFHPFA